MVNSRARSVFYQSFDGLRLHARVWEPADGPADRTVVCLPGLTRNARDFEGLALRLSSVARPWTVVAFDYRGRGLSDPSPDWRTYAVPVEARDVTDGMAALGITRTGFVGTSRGGLILHILAASHPGLIEAAVLNDIGPELGPEGLAEIRSYLSRRTRPENLDAAVAAQRATHGAAFPALSDDDWRRFAGALYRETDDGLTPDYDESLLRTLDSIDLSQPLPNLWKPFGELAKVPLMVIRGENSRLLTAETVASMRGRHPSMEVEEVRGQGHAPMLDTAGLPERIAAFFESAICMRPA